MEEVGLFDVPLSGVEDIPLNQTPWVDSQSSSVTNVNNKFVTVSETKHSKVKERKRYSVKLAKQLQSIGVNVDLISGIENKIVGDGEENLLVGTDRSSFKSKDTSSADHDFSDSNSAISTDVDSMSKRRECITPDSSSVVSTDMDSMPRRRDCNTPNKGIFESIADETLDALEDGMETKELSSLLKDGYESMSEWDPMKTSYEQKSFNSYAHQKFDDNFVEKHVPIQGPDGLKISPTKVMSEDIRLYISNIPVSLTEEGMTNMFSTTGKCKDVKKCRIREGEETTFGFVTYNSVKAAEEAICKYNEFVFGGKYKLRVKLAQNHSSKPDEHIIWGKQKTNTYISTDIRNSPRKEPFQYVKNEANGADRFMSSEPPDRFMSNEPPDRFMSNNTDLTTTTGKPPDRFMSSNVAISPTTRKEPFDYAKKEANGGDRFMSGKPPDRFMSGNAGLTTTTARKPPFDNIKKEANESGLFMPNNVAISPTARKETFDYNIKKEANESVRKSEKVPSYVPMVKLSDLETEISEIDNKQRKPRLYVQGLPVSTTELEFKELFDQVAPCCYMSIVPPKKDGQRTTYGFVSYEHLDDAEMAIEKFHDYYYVSNYLKVEYSTETKKNLGFAKDEDESFYDDLYADYSPPDITTTTTTTPRTTTTTSNVIPVITPTEEKANNVIPDVTSTTTKENEYGPSLPVDGNRSRCESSPPNGPSLPVDGNRSRCESSPPNGPSLPVDGNRSRCESSPPNKGYERWLLLLKLTKEGQRLRSMQEAKRSIKI